MCACYYCCKGYSSLCTGKQGFFADFNCIKCDDLGCYECMPDVWGMRVRRGEEEQRRKEREYAKKVAALPKQAGAIRMLRTWKLTADGDLKAMIADHTWVPGENVSLASGGNAEKDSGFYGFNSLEELQKQEADWWEKSQSGRSNFGPLKYDTNGAPLRREDDYWFVCGTILCYGHVKQSEKGGRAQKAIPEYIIEPNGSDPDFGMLVVNAAEKYGMKIVTVKQIEKLKMGLVPYKKGQPIR